MSEEHDNGMWEPPIGNDVFINLRENESYYVDKSRLIAEIIRSKGTGAFLMTRPRRFGKSLNLSMLNAFFNIAYRGNDWFEGLEITRMDGYEKEMNRYPVICISLKDTYPKEFESFVEDVRLCISEICGRFLYVLDSDMDELEKETFLKLRNRRSTIPELRRSLKDLSRILELYHREKVIILIDEYDDPIQRSYGMPAQEEVLDFMRGMLSSALKSNESLKFAVVTGVTQIAKENLFSGINNLYVDNIFSRKFDECFGFTEGEVRSMLEFYGHPERFDECKEWYDGYRFGDADVYNPWSVLNYIANEYDAKPYWAGTGDESALTAMIEGADEDMLEKLTSLGCGNEIETEIDEKILYADLAGGDGGKAFSVLAMSGYLAARRDGDIFKMRVPNRELYGTFGSLLTKGASMKSYKARSLFLALTSGDSVAVAKCLTDLMKDCLSARILDSEHAYQTFIAGLLMSFCGNYELFADRLESGEGFADIALRRKCGTRPNIVMELKRSHSESEMEKDAWKALKQISDRDYLHGIEGRTLTYGISMFRKKALVTPGE